MYGLNKKLRYAFVLGNYTKGFVSKTKLSLSISEPECKSVNTVTFQAIGTIDYSWDKCG